MRSEEREAARARGQGYVSEKADFGDTHIHSGTDPVGARRFAQRGTSCHIDKT